eukprot:scaffold58791_cov62-Phaeocystis_antarctica.AAC.1
MNGAQRRSIALAPPRSPLRLVALPLEQDILGPVEPRHLLLRLGRVAHLVGVVKHRKVAVRLAHLGGGGGGLDLEQLGGLDGGVGEGGLQLTQHLAPRVVLVLAPHALEGPARVAAKVLQVGVGHVQGLAARVGGGLARVPVGVRVRPVEVEAAAAREGHQHGPDRLPPQPQREGVTRRVLGCGMRREGAPAQRAHLVGVGVGVGVGARVGVTVEVGVG